jgi:hypothetical protein
MVGALMVAEPPKRPKGKPGPKADPERVRSSLMTVRCRPEWRDWLERLSAFKNLSAADVIDKALVLYARDEEFSEAPPKR